jgi:hypothetical protein
MLPFLDFLVMCWNQPEQGVVGRLAEYKILEVLEEHFLEYNYWGWSLEVICDM